MNLRKLCWETMFGQELVKLTIMDTIFSGTNNPASQNGKNTKSKHHRKQEISISYLFTNAFVILNELRYFHFYSKIKQKTQLKTKHFFSFLSYNDFYLMFQLHQ